MCFSKWILHTWNQWVGVMKYWELALSSPRILCPASLKIRPLFLHSNFNWCPNETFKINECTAVGVERLTGLGLTLYVCVCVFLCVSLSLLLLTKRLHAASFFTPAIDCVKWDTLFREIFTSSAQIQHTLRHIH